MTMSGVIPAGKLPLNQSVNTATDFPFSPSLAAAPRDCVMRIKVQLATASRVDVRLTRDSTTITHQLNGGNDLKAGVLRVLYVPLSADDKPTLRHSDGGAIVVTMCDVDYVIGEGPLSSQDPSGLEATIAGSVAISSVPADPFGANADAAVAAGAAGSIQAKLRRISADLDAVKTAVELIDDTVDGVSGTELQVDVVAPLPAGTNLLGYLAFQSGQTVGLDAGAQHVGQIGGHESLVAASVTIASAGYAAEDCVGGTTVLNGMARTSGVGGVITNISIADRSGTKPSLNLWLRKQSFAKAPSDSATMSAGASASFSSTDYAGLLGPFNFDSGDWKDAGAEAIISLDKVIGFEPASGTALEMVLKTETTITSAASDSSFEFNFSVLQS